MRNLGAGDGKTDALLSIDEICRLLQAHPKFREVPVVRVVERSPAGLAIGRLLKSARSRSFGVEFAGSLTLWRFLIRREQPRTLSLDLRWQVEKPLGDWRVFIHFVDSAGEIRFQGDYPLKGAMPDLFGFVYSRRVVVVPAEVPDGVYGVRLGVWSPGDGARLQLTQFRGCQRDSGEGWRDAVIVATVTI